MADTPSSGTDVAALGISVDSRSAVSAEKDLDNLDKTTVRVAKDLDDLGTSSNRSSANVATAAERYRQASLTLTGLAEAKRNLALAQAEEDKINAAAVATGTALEAKLQDLLRTYGLTQEQVMRLTAAEVGMSEALNPLIAQLEVLKAATAQYGKVITDVASIEAARIEFETSAQTAFNAFKIRTLAENAAREEAAATALNAQRIREKAEQLALEESSQTALNAQRIRALAEMRAAYIADWEAQKQFEKTAQAELNGQRIEALRTQAQIEKVARAELNGQRIDAIAANERAAVALAEKQAIEEIKWNELSVETRIAALERLKVWQANAAIRPETVSANFSSAAINDLPNLTRLQNEYNAAVLASKTAHSVGAEGAKGFSSAIDGVTFSNKLAYRELLVMSHEAVQGSWKRMATSAMVLAEYTNMAALAFTGFGIGILAAIAGLGLLAYAVIKGISQQKDFNDALIMTGNYAGTTGEGLHKMAVEAAGSANSIGVAKEAVAQLAATGKFTGEQIGEVGTAVVALEHATGASIDKTIKQFESLQVQATGYTHKTATTISDSLVKLDDQYHFLTVSVYDQIRALEAEGKQKEASALATTEFARVTEARANESVANLGHIENAWKGIKHAIGEVIDALGNIGKRVGAEELVKKIQSQIDALQVVIDRPKSGSSLLGGPSTEAAMRKMTELINQRTAAEVELYKRGELSYRQAADAQAQSEGVHAAQQIASQREAARTRNQTNLERDLAKAKEWVAKVVAANPESPYADPKYAEAYYDDVRAMNTQKAVKGLDDRKNILRDLGIVEQTALDRDKQIYEERDKMLDLYHKKFGMGDDEFYAGRKVARDDYVAAEQASYDKQVAIVKNFHSKNPNEVAAMKVKYDQLIKAHLDFLDKMKAADVADNAANAAATEQAYNDAQKAIDDFGSSQLTALSKSIDKQKEHNAEIGKTKEQIELARQAQSDATTADMEGQAEALRATLDDITLKNVLVGKDRELYTNLLSYLDQVIAKRKEDAAWHNTNAAVEADAALAKKAEQEWDRLNRKIGDDLASAIVDGGGNGVKKLIHDMEVSFAKAILRPILAPISGAIASFGSSGIGAESQIPGMSVGGGDSSNPMSMLGTIKNLYTTMTTGFSGLATSITGYAQSAMDFMGISGTAQAGTVSGVSDISLGAAGGASAEASALGTVGSYAAGIGAGIMLGSAISGKFSLIGDNPMAASAIGAAIGAGIGGPVGAVIGGALGGVVNRAFGMGPEELRGKGIEGTFGPGGFSGNTYTDIHQDGGWFRGDNNEHRTGALDLSSINQLGSAFSAMKEVTSNFAKSLGIDTAAIAGFTTNMHIEMTGDAAKDQAAITKFFDDTANAMANTLPVYFQQFAKQGESMAATLQRLSTDLTAANAMLGTLNHRLYDTSIYGANMASQLVDLFGGLSNMQSISAAYFQSYYSDVERVNITTQQLTQSFNQLGFAMPVNQAALRAQIESLDINTDAGRRAYVQLMTLSGAFAQLTTATEQLHAAADQERKGLQDQLNQLTMNSAQLLALQRAALDESNRALFDQVQAATAYKAAKDKASQDLQSAYEAETSAIQETIDRMKSFVTSLKSFKDGLMLDGNSPLTPEQKYAEAKRQYDQTLAAAKGGDVDAQGRLTGAASAFLDASRVANASDLQYQTDFAAVQNAMDDMANWAAAQVDVGHASLIALNQQLQGLVEIKEAVLSVSDALNNFLNLGFGSVTGTTSNGFLVPNTGAFAGMGDFSSTNNSPINYTQTGTINMTPLVNEIKSLRASNEALLVEVKNLRVEQRQQTSDVITTNYDATNKAADKVVTATVQAAEDVVWAETSRPAIV